MSNLYLVGLRGSGKTTIGGFVASALHREFVDTDRMIQQRTGCSIAQLFSERGEAGFRELEADAIAELAQQRGIVIALGGGACERRENREALKRSGFVVWLTASPPRLWERITGDPLTIQQRPALSDKTGVAELEWLAEQRRANYAACADFTWETDLRTPQESAKVIAEWWQNADKGWG